MKSERRQHKRVAVEVDVEVLVHVDKKRAGLVTDISETGLFVQTIKHVEVGNFVVIKFSGQQVMFGATVHRVTENGFGAKFGGINDAHRDAIASFLPKTIHSTVSSVVQMPTVMLLCDNGSYSILEQKLKEAGFAVLQVKSIDKVIFAIELLDVVCIVSDYIVGGKDTLSILKKIKEPNKQLDFPVIIYSGRYDVPYKQFELLGVQCFYKHNTSPLTLVRHIKKTSSAAYK